MLSQDASVPCSKGPPPVPPPMIEAFPTGGITGLGVLDGTAVGVRVGVAVDRGEAVGVGVPLGGGDPGTSLDQPAAPRSVAFWATRLNRWPWCLSPRRTASFLRVPLAVGNTVFG